MGEAKKNWDTVLGSYYGESHEGRVVLNAEAMNHAKNRLGHYFSHAQRTESVFVWKPEAGDTITESGRPSITAKGNETVFLKRLGKGQYKVYIPSGSDGPLDEAILDDKYEKGVPSSAEDILAQLPQGAALTERKPKELKIDILHECITQPSIMLNARGEGKHQTLEIGDSLKFEDGECLPLPKKELDVAWNVTPKARGVV